MREHRLYQADWLMRYCGLSTQELKAVIPISIWIRRPRGRCAIEACRLVRFTVR